MNFDGFISYSHAADGRLAPAVQRGLHRLAKPWHRRRALWIFRDQTGLSVTPGLWSSIQRALDGSEWFVLLASPEAARSPWVNREIEHWIATKPANRILPVVTDGEWEWDPAVGDLTAGSTAVPDALRGVFGEEPLYLDLRWARDDGQLSLQHPRFRDAIAQLAAPMHGISMDELEGEDVRQHRRVRRVRRVAVAALSALTVVAALSVVVARNNADRATTSAADARHQAQDAERQRGNAERSLLEAQRQENNARTQEERARAATTERVRQENRAREQQAAAERAATEAKKQQKNASRQQALAKRAQTLAEEQKAVAREQSELAQESASETNLQRLVAERQQRLAADAAADAENQKRVAEHQQWLAGEATAEALRQAGIAEQNVLRAKQAEEDARRQEENAAEQKQMLLSRKLLNQAAETISDDPATALRLGLAAQKIQPGTTAGSELAGLVTSTRLVGTASDVVAAAYGPNDVIAVIEASSTLSLRSVANRAAPAQLASIEGEKFREGVVFSPDGKTLAVPELWDGQPTLFDVSEPAHPKRLGTVPVLYARWLAFSPDGQTLAAATSDGKWTLWNTTDRANPVLLTSQTKGFVDEDDEALAVAPISFGPDGHTLVTAGEPGIVWDITDPTKPAEVGTLDGSWQTVAFSPTRPLLASSDANGDLALWHMDDRTKPQKFSTTPARSQGVTFSRDGLTLATTDNDGTARLWDLTDDAIVHLADVNDHSGYTTSVAFSPDGRTLTTATGRLSLWTVEATGQPTILSQAVGRAPRRELLAALTPDGKRLTTVNMDGTATVWDVSRLANPVERATVRIDPDSADGAAISPNGDTLAVLGWTVPGSGAALFDLTDPNQPTQLSALTIYFDQAMAFSPDGLTLAVTRNQEVLLWSLRDRQKPVQVGTIPGKTLVHDIEFSPDGNTVAVATSPSIVTLWNVTDRSNPVQRGTLKGHSDVVTAMAFSPDSRTLATGSKDRTAALWNVADQTPLRRLALLTGNGTPVRSVAFAPDGRTLATGTSDDAVALWDLTELSGPVRVATVKRGNHGSGSVLFHPDGRTLTTSGSQTGKSQIAIQWDYSALNDLRANPAAHACAVTGGGFTEDEWAAHIPDAPYQPTCP